MSYFDAVEQLPEDPILSLPFLFAADIHKDKLNLGIGSYKDEHGKPQILECVRKAEKQVLEKEMHKEYLPIQGDPEHIEASTKLLLGPLAASLQERLFGMQTLGGTGALRVSGEFLSRNNFKNIFLPSPTWPNHRPIFTYAGLQLNTYPYYDVAKHELDFSGMCNAIERMPPQSIILFHACCHNPSGMDPSHEQWMDVSRLVKKQKLIPIFDVAYQGFGQSLEEDVYAVRIFAQQGHEMFIANSYSKNMGLYGERAGSLVAITESKEAVKRVSSQLKQIVRGMYSMPPLHSARIVSTVLRTDSLAKLWDQELSAMRDRIKKMRFVLISKLKDLGVDYSFLAKQSGIFCYLGFTSEQVMRMRTEYGVYLADHGRANLAGLNQENIDKAAIAIANILKSGQ